jgi:ABC-type multidrug transport system permease subunit
MLMSRLSETAQVTLIVAALLSLFVGSIALTWWVWPHTLACFFYGFQAGIVLATWLAVAVQEEKNKSS